MNRRLTCTIAGSLSLLLSGCMVGPKYKRPAVPMSPAFKEAPTADTKPVDGWRPAVPADAILRGSWWQIYGDARLNALEVQVDSANQTLKMADANYRQERTLIQYNKSFEAPTLGVDPGLGTMRYSYNQPYVNKSLVNGGDGFFSLPVDLNWEIDLWGSIRRSVSSAKEQTQASAGDLAAMRLSLHAELARDYIELRAADAQKQLLDATVQAYNKALGLTENRFEGGAAPKSDVAQARTQLQDAQVLDTDIVATRAQYEHAIAVLIGKPPASFTLPPIALNIDPLQLPGIPAVVPSELLERRPDIAAAERRVASANEQIGIAQAAYYPSLNLSAEAGMMGTSALNWFSWPSRFWAAGPTLSETIFDAGRRRSVKNAALAGYDGYVASYRQTTLDAFQQVEDNLVVLHVLSSESQQQHQATSSAEMTLRLFQDRYVGGMVTYLEVVNSQTAALSNECNDIDIMRRQLEASVMLIKALGGGWNTGKLPKV